MMPDLPQLTSGYGQFHTDEEGSRCRRPYAQIDLDGIRALVDEPQQVDKAQAQWLIPSTLRSRTFKTQEESGSFWMLWADIDKDPPVLDQLQKTICNDLIAESDHEIYTSRSAREDYQKSRVLVPLLQPLSGADWVLCQQIFNDKLEAAGVVPDRKSEGAAQLCYLPNRGEFYDSRSVSNDNFFNPLSAWSTEIAEKRQEVDKSAAEARQRKEAAKANQAARKHSGQGSLRHAFNDVVDVGEIMLMKGYDQDGNRDSYRHPDSESGSYSASVRGGRVHSLSSNDPLYTGGSGGGAHDSFSAFTRLFHDGNDNAAMKDAGDNWVKIDGKPWNKVKQREHMQEQELLRGAGDLSATSAAKAVASVAQGIMVDEITLDEMHAARLTPRVILRDLLYADVRTRIAAGGVGKTTIAIFEAVTLALGRDL